MGTQSTTPQPFNHPKMILTVIFCVCALICGLSTWIRLYADLLLSGMEDQIRTAVSFGALFLAVFFGLLAFCALWGGLNLPWRRGSLVLGVLSLGAGVWGLVQAFQAILYPEIPDYLAAYLGRPDPFGTIWYGVVPLAFALLCLGLFFKADARKILLGEAVLLFAAGCCAAVYMIRSQGKESFMWMWNLYLPYGLFLCCIYGAFRKTARYLLIGGEILFGLLSLAGLYNMIISGGSDNAICVVFPAAVALGIQLVRREIGQDQSRTEILD